MNGAQVARMAVTSAFRANVRHWPSNVSTAIQELAWHRMTFSAK